MECAKYALVTFGSIGGEGSNFDCSLTKLISNQCFGAIEGTVAVTSVGVWLEMKWMMPKGSNNPGISFFEFYRLDVYHPYLTVPCYPLQQYILLNGKPLLSVRVVNTYSLKWSWPWNYFFLSTCLRMFTTWNGKTKPPHAYEKKKKKSLKSRRIYPNQSDVFSIAVLSIQNVVLAVCDNSRLHVQLSIGKHWYNPNVTMPCTILGRGPSIFIKVPLPTSAFVRLRHQVDK